MAKYDVNLLEETLKIKVRDDYFPKFKMGQIGKIDFVISITKEIERPLLRIEITKAAKSWNAPTNTQPTKIQIKAGSQPKYAAIIGPTIGPGPAIDAKW